MRGHWMGEQIDDMPREKLLEIIDELGRELAQYGSPEMTRALSIGKSYLRITARSKALEGK